MEYRPTVELDDHPTFIGGESDGTPVPTDVPAYVREIPTHRSQDVYRREWFEWMASTGAVYGRWAWVLEGLPGESAADVAIPPDERSRWEP